MSLTPNEAADALRDIESASRRSGEAFGYRLSAPFFMIWGVGWFVGYGVTDLAPAWAGVIWPVVIVAGTLACIVVGRFIGRGRKLAGNPSAWRFLALSLIIWLFLAATYTVLGPIGPRQQAVFPPLLAAALYSAMGLWLGSRYVVTGAAVAILALGGFFYLHAHFELWMAVVGGGGLILAGVWMRTA